MIYGCYNKHLNKVKNTKFPLTRWIDTITTRFLRDMKFIVLPYMRNVIVVLELLNLRMVSAIGN